MLYIEAIKHEWGTYILWKSLSSVSIRNVKDVIDDRGINLMLLYEKYKEIL